MDDTLATLDDSKRQRVQTIEVHTCIVALTLHGVYAATCMRSACNRGVDRLMLYLASSHVA